MSTSITTDDLRPHAFLVGGAVRDRLLGVQVHDRDWVVVGHTKEDMVAAGFQQVGAGFPVFLHPVTKEEYALARTERKTAPGTRGFEVYADPSVTLEEDLRRRDLTINAIAMTADGTLVDPYGGAQDLKDKVLRHVSEAFVEDPLRVLRVARFAARYAPMGFTIAPETMDLMRAIVERGEVDTLVPERVWGEWVKSVATEKPSVFLHVLRECGALARVLPEVDALYGVPQVALHHPEIDTGIHTEMVVDQASILASGDTMVAFAALTHDLGKALTPKEQWPQHQGHEKSGLKPLKEMMARLKVPTDHARLARLVCEHHLTMHRAMELRTGTLCELFETMGAFQHPERLEPFIQACAADKRGRLGKEHDDYPQGPHVRAVLAAGLPVNATPFLEKGWDGPKIGYAVKQARIRAMDKVHGPVRKVEPPRPPKKKVPGM